MNEWLRIAFTGPVVRRGLKYAVLVGAILVVINHGDTLLARHLTPATLVKIGLTVVVPYCVSVLSSVGAILDVRARERASAPPPGSRP